MGNLVRAVDFLRPYQEALDGLLGAARGQALLGLLGTMASVAQRSQRDALSGLEKMQAYLEHAQELLSIQRAYAGAGSDIARGKVSLGRVLLDAQSMMASALEKRGRSDARIEIEAMAVSAGVEIAVSDNGPGIPASVRDKLFKPFASAGRVDGTGFGLAIVQQIVLAHHGRVSVESSSLGTRFTLLFPSAQPVAPS